MITYVVHLQVRPENAAAYEALMEEVGAKSREEPGVVYYEYAKSVREPNTYLVIEVYRDTEAHAAHMDSAWVRESLPVSAKLIEGRPQIRQYVSPGAEPVTRRYT